ncbi:DUF4129 domain-containing protein [Streptomyces sp. URMC 123]|uniref:DUF4129 domain-containing protein n=1 Tax=Streptomyces sp. URMC 123 TaxID=3423403 RepID=UPI003F196BB9
MTATGGTAVLVRLLATGDEPPVTISRSDAREAAEPELDKPMYHRNEPGLFQRALDWLWRRVDDLFDTASGASPGGTVGLVVIVVLVLLLVVALRWRLGALRRTPSPAAALFDEGPRSAADHRATAERHAANHEWTHAVQERMRAIVRSLEERALLDPRPGRTADEAAAEAARTLPHHADRLTAAARTFDDVTYGGRPATEAAYLRLRDLDLALQDAKPLVTTAHSGDTP